MRYLDPARVAIVLVALVGLLATSAKAGEPPSPPAGWTDGFVMANGIRIHDWRRRRGWRCLMSEANRVPPAIQRGTGSESPSV